MTPQTPVPCFAVVGHPNKGKSSLVSTLSQDESVVVSPLSGTTSRNMTYPMQIDGTTLYQLIDTPGFQRPRAAIAWMQKKNQSIIDRSDTVREFIRQHHKSDTFLAECELLKPIMAGAGILYVVDGSRPYGAEYNAEMEILRWTGQPSMALINQTARGSYIEEWRQTLAQYFRIVRIFNTHTADFEKQIQLLSGFAELNENWRDALIRAVEVLKAQRLSKRRAVAALLADMISKMLTLSIGKEIPDSFSADESETTKHALLAALRTIEQQCRRSVESLYHYHSLGREERMLSLVDDDLFSASSWELFGLSNDQALAAGAVGGAATGSIVDMAFGGASLLFGAGVGAVTGGVMARLGNQTLAKSKIRGQHLGRRKLVVGPIKNISFPYVVLGRALVHHFMVERRTHAQRSTMQITQPSRAVEIIFDEDRKDFARLFANIRRIPFNKGQSHARLSDKIHCKLQDDVLAERLKTLINGKG